MNNLTENKFLEYFNDKHSKLQDSLLSDSRLFDLFKLIGLDSVKKDLMDINIGDLFLFPDDNTFEIRQLVKPIDKYALSYKQNVKDNSVLLRDMLFPRKMKETNMLAYTLNSKVIGDTNNSFLITNTLGRELKNDIKTSGIIRSPNKGEELDTSFFANDTKISPDLFAHIFTNDEYLRFDLGYDLKENFLVLTFMILERKNYIDQTTIEVSNENGDITDKEITINDENLNHHVLFPTIVIQKVWNKDNNSPDRFKIISVYDCGETHNNDCPLNFQLTNGFYNPIIKQEYTNIVGRDTNYLGFTLYLSDLLPLYKFNHKNSIVKLISAYATY